MDENLIKLDLEEKIEQSKTIIGEALEKFGDDLVIAFTGGKDSTVVLWLFREVCKESGADIPKCMFIDEGHLFEEILEFTEEIKTKWNLIIDYVQNKDVLKNVEKVGDMVKVKDLHERNKMELFKLNFHEIEFPFEPESYVGNHLMKTVAMNMFLEEKCIKAVATGIRWDEQDARKDEAFFSPRYDPDHTRVHPILHFNEKDIWNTIKANEIPCNKLYSEGYRSLGAKSTTLKKSNIPAWEQDLENTTEREGRRQDKENIMEKLRELGYM